MVHVPRPDTPSLLSPASAIDGIAWPALPGSPAAQLLSVIYQLDQSQWLAPEQLLERQRLQLGSLLRHAYLSVPFYRTRLDRTGYSVEHPITLEQWDRLPLLQRDEIQESGPDMLSRRFPKSHGKPSQTSTSGSSGQPITVTGSSITSFFWHAFGLREHLWHRRDFHGKFVAIRAEGTRNLPATGRQFPNWGAPASLVTDTGPSAILNIQTDIPAQADWLLEQDPDYLLTHPTNLFALADHFLRNGKCLSRLREVRTFGENLRPGLREACRRAWDVPLVDMYSTQEVGYIAFQCPENESYHVQAENLYVEILDDRGRPCRPGDTGRVVVTTLHNYAMPLIRYELLDYARAGDACPCGRGLPVIEHIAGRQRNMLVLPNGETHWPRFPAKLWADIAPVIRQVQLIQRDLHTLEARLVVKRPLTASEEERCQAVLNERFGYPFALKLTYLDSIPRKPNGKFEDFISEVRL